MIPFSILIDFNSNLRMSYIYYTIMIPTLIWTQSLAHISAILTMPNIQSAMLISQVILNVNSQLSNGLMPTKSMKYSIRMFSELSYFKLMHDFIVLNMYGLNRCDPNQTSIVLNIFDINDDMFWPIIIKIIIHIVVIKIITFVLFVIRFNKISANNLITYPFNRIFMIIRNS